MTHSPEKWLEALGALRVPPEPAEHAAARRVRTVRHLEALDQGHARALHRRRRMAPLLAAAAVAASVALVVTAVVLRASPEPQTRITLGHGQVLILGDRGASSALTPEVVLSPTDRIRTPPHASAELLTAEGVKLELATDSEARLQRLGRDEIVSLEKGGVSLSVPKLPAGNTLQVQTFDTRVTVKGTRFEVVVHRKASDRAPFTEVRVSEGVVEVVSQGNRELLGAASQWTSRPPSPHSPSPSASSALVPPIPSVFPQDTAPSTSPTRPEPRTVRSAVSHGNQKQSAERPSSLADENALLSQLRAEVRQGNLTQALSTADQFVARFPRSPLTHNVEVEQFRLLARLGRKTDARRAAQAYLARHPEGFAAREARGLTESSSP